MGFKKCDLLEFLKLSFHFFLVLEWFYGKISQFFLHQIIQKPVEPNLLGGDFKNKQTTKQLFGQEYNCLNFLDFKTFV